MTKTARVALGIVVVGVAAISLSGWLIVGRGFSTREEPSAVETLAARWVRGWAIPKTAADMQNPVAASPEVLSEAMAHFADHCATCHANDGSGDAPIGKGLYPKPPDMRLAETQHLSDGELFYIIHNGVRMTGMPAFGQENEAAPDLDSWKLVHFIRHLPKLTSQEVETMKTMNPKSPHEMEEEAAIQRFLAGEDIQPSTAGHNHD